MMETTCKIERVGECDKCDGTGLYVGLAERPGAAVVCWACDGEGRRTYRLVWKEFHGRKRRPRVERVFQVNPGGVVDLSEGRAGMENSGGMPYSDWLEGRPFPDKSEDRLGTCPAWWWQSADYTQKPDWEECLLNPTGRFRDCPRFRSRDSCWRRFDEERRGG